MGGIICGDSLEWLRRVPVGRLKMLFADIPDNIGLGYRGYNDKRGAEEYYRWIRELILESLLKAPLFWLSYNTIHDIEIKWMVRDILRYRHPSYSGETFIWRYTFSQYTAADCAHGFRPILRIMRTGCKLYPDAIKELSRRQLIGDARSAGDRVPDNVWSIPRVVGNSPERCAWHPTQFPIALMERIIKFSCDGVTERFADLFAGTGSMLRAAQRLDERAGRAFAQCCTVIDIDEFYCEKISTDTKIEMVKFDPIIMEKL